MKVTLKACFLFLMSMGIAFALYIPSSFAASPKVDLLEHKKLLLTHNFEALEERLDFYNNGYLNGQISKKDYYWSVENLWTVRKDEKDKFKAALEKWIKAYPDSAQAHIAMGEHYATEGYNARGNKWASETSIEQFSEMEKQFAKAQEHLDTGIEINPSIIKGYTIKMGILRNSKSNQRHMQLVPRMMAYMRTVPINIKARQAVWWRFIDLLTPRWGGSYHKMQDIIDTEIPKFIPDLSLKAKANLEDAILHDKMSALALEKKYRSVINLSKKRISEKTTSPGVYNTAANATYKIKDYQNCFKYARRSANLRPWRSYGWKNVGACAYRLERWADMKAAYSHRIYIKGVSAYRLYYLAMSYMHLKQYAKAYVLFKEAEDMDPSYYEEYTKNYVGYIEKNKKAAMILRKKGLTAYDIIGTLYYKTKAPQAVKK